MNNKIKITLGTVAIILLILIISNVTKNNSNRENIETEETTLSDVQYNENTGEYYIEDEETGEVLHTAYSEEELYIYSIDPNYDPKNPDAVDEYEYYEDAEEIEE